MPGLVHAVVIGVAMGLATTIVMRAAGPALYALLAGWWPDGAFQGIAFDDDAFQLDSFLYFSFVTLTTAGYGDIVPLNPMIRTMAYLEMVVGQFYLAVLVAGLVGVSIVAQHATQERRAAEQELASVREQLDAAGRALGYDEATLAAVFHGNAEKLFGITAG